MAFDFNSLSNSPLSPKERVVTTPTSTGKFNFNEIPKSPLELIGSKMYEYGAKTPEAFGLSSTTLQAQPQAGWGIGIGGDQLRTKGTAQTTPMVAEQLPEPKSYLEGVADIINSTVETGKQNREKYKAGEISGATKYSGDIAGATTIAVAPLMEVFNQIPVVSGIMQVMGEGLTFGQKGLGEKLADIPGYSQILEKNPWITDYSEAVSPTVENATVTAMNLATLLGTVESGIKAGVRGKTALEYRVTKDADGKLLTRNGDGDVVYIEDKNGVPTYGEKPADYPLIRLNSALQDLKKSSGEAIESKKVAKNAETVKEIITGTKSGQNWWAQNPESEAATQRVASKVDLSNSIDTNGTVNTKPQQEYFKQTYLDKTEATGYKLLEKEDASVNLKRIEDKLIEEFGNTNLPQSIVKKAIETILRKLSTTADELGNVKLIETAKEKSAAQRNANYERTQNNSNAEIKNKTVGRALRLVVEETSKTDIAKVNGELSKLYQELAILERLDAMKVAGGKLGKYFSQISGNIVGGLAGGAVGGPAGAAAAAVVGGELASALRGRIMAGKFKSTTPKGEIGATLEKAIAETKKPKKVDLKTPDKKVGAPKTVKKTPEIVKLEGKIAKNVDAQKAAIKAKDYTLVAKLKQAYDVLVAELKKAIKYLNENASVGMATKDVTKKLPQDKLNILRDYVTSVRLKVDLPKQTEIASTQLLRELGISDALDANVIANRLEKIIESNKPGTKGKKPTGKEGVSKQSVGTSGDFGGYVDTGKTVPGWSGPDKVYKVPISDLRAHANPEFKDALRNVDAGAGTRSTGVPVTLVKKPNGRVFIVDGHHRVIEAMKQGDATVEATFLDYKDEFLNPDVSVDTRNLIKAGGGSHVTKLFKKK